MAVATRGTARSVDTYTQTEMAGIDALREGSGAAKEKTKGAIEGAEEKASDAYESTKEKVKR
jgi:hypothetical protein